MGPGVVQQRTQAEAEVSFLGEVTHETSVTSLLSLDEVEVRTGDRETVSTPVIVESRHHPWETDRVLQISSEGEEHIVVGGVVIETHSSEGEVSILTTETRIGLEVAREIENGTVAVETSATETVDGKEKSTQIQNERIGLGGTVDPTVRNRATPIHLHYAQVWSPGQHPVALRRKVAQIGSIQSHEIHAILSTTTEKQAQQKFRRKALFRPGRQTMAKAELYRLRLRRRRCRHSDQCLSAHQLHRQAYRIKTTSAKMKRRPRLPLQLGVPLLILSKMRHQAHGPTS